MDDRSVLCGILHYRSDLGDGTRTGVVFFGCAGGCDRGCCPKLIRKQLALPGEENTVRRLTALELGVVLQKEKECCPTRSLGITFLGREPLAEARFCFDAGQLIREAGMNLLIQTCGMCSREAFDSLGGIGAGFLVNFFSPVLPKDPAFGAYLLQEAIDNLFYLDQSGFSYRVRVPVLPGINENAAPALATFLCAFKNLKSVVLDFGESSLSEALRKEYRAAFLSKGIVLY